RRASRSSAIRLHEACRGASRARAPCGAWPARCSPPRRGAWHEARRRTTMNSTVSPHPTTRPEWLARREEEILEPDLPIIDPHHHLLDRSAHGTYLLPELLADLASGHRVVATVYLEWLSMYRADGPVEMRPVGEVEFAKGVAAMSASGTHGAALACAGIVGHGELTLGSRVAEVLEAMIAAGGGRFHGVRLIAASDPDQPRWGSPVVRPQ